MQLSCLLQHMRRGRGRACCLPWRISDLEVVCLEYTGSLDGCMVRSDPVKQSAQHIGRLVSCRQSWTQQVHVRPVRIRRDLPDQPAPVSLFFSWHIVHHASGLLSVESQVVLLYCISFLAERNSGLGEVLLPDCCRSAASVQRRAQQPTSDSSPRASLPRVSASPPRHNKMPFKAFKEKVRDLARDR